jgi:hypothetical protein
MLARIRISECRDQHRACVGRHVQAVGDECQRTEQAAADDFRNHHRGTQSDHRPCSAFVLFMGGAQKNMIVSRAEGGVSKVTHVLLRIT